MSEVIDFKAAVEKKALKEEIENPPHTINDADIEDLVFSFVQSFAGEVEDELGVDLSSHSETLYDAWVIVEAMKSSVYRALDVKYPFQVATQDMFRDFHPDEDIENFFDE